MPDWNIRVEVLAQEGDVYVALDMYDGTGGDQSGAAALDSYLVDVLRDAKLAREEIFPHEHEREPRSSASSRYRPIRERRLDPAAAVRPGGEKPAVVAVQPSESIPQVRPRRLHDQVDVVGHKAGRPDDPPGPSGRFVKKPQVRAPIGVVVEDRAARIAARDHVID